MFNKYNKLLEFGTSMINLPFLFSNFFAFLKLNLEILDGLLN